MKKIITLLMVLALTLTMAGCSSTDDESADMNIKVGATLVPHAEMLEEIKATLAEEGYTLDIVEYTDYIQPNVALADGALDANFFQHIPYLENYNEENGTNLISAFPVHFEPLGIYPGRAAAFTNLEDGAKVAVPNDPTNEARALLLLQEAGLIELKEDAGLLATVNDIVTNEMNLEIIEMEAAQMPRILPDVDIAVINGNYALEAGFTVEDDALLAEEATSLAAQMYANPIVVRDGDEDLPKIKALIAAISTEEMKAFIQERYQGSVVPVF